MSMTTPGSGGGPHLATCVERAPAEIGPAHDHVTFVKTEAEGHSPRRWRVVDVIAAIRAGDEFAIDDEQGEVEIAPAICPHCSAVTLIAVRRAARGERDALEALPACEG